MRGFLCVHTNRPFECAFVWRVSLFCCLYIKAMLNLSGCHSQRHQSAQPKCHSCLSLSSTGFYTDGANEWTQPWLRKELQWGWTTLLSSQSSFSLNFSSFSHMFFHLKHHFLFTFIFHPPASSFFLISAFCISFFLSVSSFQSLSFPFSPPVSLMCAHTISIFCFLFLFLFPFVTLLKQAPALD